VSASVRVLIVSRDEAFATPLAHGLDLLGWRTVTARGAHSAAVALEDLPIEAAVVIEADPRDALAVAERLRAARAPRPLPVISVPTGSDPGDMGVFDLSLSRACHPTQLALRLKQLMRASAAEEEFELRRRTFAELGYDAPRASGDTSPLQVLTVGEPAPKFLALSHALRQHGAEVTGAFTAYTAFDYLHERAFDAVVLWAGETQTEALSIAGGMRRNSRLYHLPTLLYLRSHSEIDLAGAYRRGLTDIATADTDEAETARRTVALAHAYRREGAIRRALESVRGPGLTDPATGLFTEAMYASHVARMTERAAELRRPLSLAMLRVSETAAVRRARATGWMDKALPQIGSMIGRLVRAEDTAARIGSEMFALALPSADEAAAHSAVNRIAAVVACTAFPAGDGERPFTVEFETGAAQLRPGETAGRALERAAAALEATPAA
jgi:two-component system, cell cycle response regulator PopA